MSRALLEQQTVIVLEIRDLRDSGQINQAEYEDLFNDLITLEKIQSELDEMESALTAQQIYQVLKGIAGLSFR